MEIEEREREREVKFPSSGRETTIPFVPILRPLACRRDLGRVYAPTTAVGAARDRIQSPPPPPPPALPLPPSSGPPLGQISLALLARFLPSFLSFLLTHIRSRLSRVREQQKQINTPPPRLPSPLLSRPRLLFLFFFSFFFSPLHLVVDTFTSFFFFALPYSYVRVGWHTRDKRSGFRVSWEELGG